MFLRCQTGVLHSRNKLPIAKSLQFLFICTSIAKSVQFLFICTIVLHLLWVSIPRVRSPGPLPEKDFSFGAIPDLVFSSRPHLTL